MTKRNQLLYNLTAGLPCRLIPVNGRPYLERYYVGQLFGVTFYLHRFVSADRERHIHNHPWQYGGAAVLAGSYTEEVATDLCPHAGPSGCVTFERRVRWLNRVDGSRFHRISDAAPGTWTLFAHGRRERVGASGMASMLKGWGFFDRGYVLGEQVTVFKPYVKRSTDHEWWLKAPTGAVSGRVAL